MSAANLDLEAPPLPPRPSTVGRVRGHVVSQCPPTTLTIVGLFSASVAIWRYVISDYFLAGSFTGICVLNCAMAGCFWKYVGAQAIEDSTGEMRRLVRFNQDLVEWLKRENEKLKVEVDRFDELMATLSPRQEEHVGSLQSGNEILAVTAGDLRERIEELERFIDLHKSFEANIARLKDTMRRFIRQAPELRRQFEGVRGHTEAIQGDTEQVERCIEAMNTVDDGLVEAIEAFGHYMGKLEVKVASIYELYRQTRAERDRLHHDVQELGDRNKELDTSLDRYNQIIYELESNISNYEELALLLRNARPPKLPKSHSGGSRNQPRKQGRERRKSMRSSNHESK